MAGATDAAYELVVVVVGPAPLELVAVAVGVDDEVARPQVVGDGVAHAAAVRRSYGTDASVGRLVRVTGDHDVGISAVERGPSSSSGPCGVMPWPSSRPGDACTPSTRVPSSSTSRTSSGRDASHAVHSGANALPVHAKARCTSGIGNGTSPVTT